MSKTTLSNNSLAFIALCNEYCNVIESCTILEQSDLIDKLIHLLPRIYISAIDLKDEIGIEPVYTLNRLEEEYYDSIRRNLETAIGINDVYLEVFEEDMKYSDTPISANISENLADIFQAIYNFIDIVKDAPTEDIPVLIKAAKEDFDSYWSQILCNVLRALNNIRNKEESDY